MRLIHKALALGTGGVLVLGVAGTLVIVNAQASLHRLSTYQHRDAALQSSVAALRSDFESYDDQNANYVLIAATDISDDALWQAREQQAGQAATQMHSDLQVATKLSGDATTTALLKEVGTDLDSYDAMFKAGIADVTKGSYDDAAHEETVSTVKTAQDLLPALTKLQQRADAAAAVLDVDEFLPAVGQGAIGIETRADDSRTRDWLKPINHADTATALAAERAFLAVLDGSCRTPIGGHATIAKGTLRFRGMVVKPDGSEAFETTREGKVADAEALGADAGAELKARAGSDFFAKL